MRHKRRQLSGLKVDGDAGKVRAVFATLNVRDSDGDVTRPGAFGEQTVRMSAHNHESWFGALPIGRGKIFEDGDEAIFEGEFFLNTAAGHDTFEVVKGLSPDLQEWSYGYDILESAQGEIDDLPVTFLDDLKVHEVSPVLLGAGVDTRTLEVKGSTVNIIDATTGTSVSTGTATAGVGTGKADAAESGKDPSADSANIDGDQSADQSGRVRDLLTEYPRH